MPRLDQRLKLVARQIRARCHADIGSDHGHLLKALLAAGRIERGIAIENKRQPWANSQATLRGLPADVRFGEGLQPLRPGEADSASICGMGGRSIERILGEAPERIPERLVLQPNKHAEQLRRWAFAAGYHLQEELRTAGRRRFDVLVFVRGDGHPDPVYDSLDREAALVFGPWHLRRWETWFVQQLQQQQRYLATLGGRDAVAGQRLAILDRLLAAREKHPQKNFAQTPPRRYFEK
ncbi:class I SAM-dependent methyltransferase [Roseimaritima sediminicola]|uniref:class I SAM-dependent methyltransferase n=1 Tax=Roseimaritima sediminicola TaxID=2662066 RepID=UPI00129833E3|nr:class I SAM-dependent methyltransferase [Roseimaritima sediminicola]